MRISFFAQSQQHIAAVALRLETHERGEIAVTSQPEGIQLELTQDGRATVFPRITLSIRLLPNRQTITLNRNDGVYEIKLPVEPKAVGLDVMKVPVSARELDARKVRRARCMRCRNIVWDARTLDPPEFDTNISVDDTPPRKIPRQDGLSQERKSYTFRALPSAHWHESSEAWLCHPSGEFTGKLQRWVEKGWWPRWTVALVGERAVGVRVKPGMEEGPGIVSLCFEDLSLSVIWRGLGSHGCPGKGQSRLARPLYCTDGYGTSYRDIPIMLVRRMLACASL